MPETYPHSDLLVRICYGCDELVDDIEELWVDVDSNCCVCTACRNKSRDSYRNELTFYVSIVPAITLEPNTLNEMDEG
jgi:hypothetical protein